MITFLDLKNEGRTGIDLRVETDDAVVSRHIAFCTCGHFCRAFCTPEFIDTLCCLCARQSYPHLKYLRCSLHGQKEKA